MPKFSSIVFWGGFIAMCAASASITLDHEYSRREVRQAVLMKRVYRAPGKHGEPVETENFLPAKEVKDGFSVPQRKQPTWLFVRDVQSGEFLHIDCRTSVFYSRIGARISYEKRVGRIWGHVWERKCTQAP